MTKRRPGAKRGAPHGNRNAYKHGAYEPWVLGVRGLMWALRGRIYHAVAHANTLIAKDKPKQLRRLGNNSAPGEFKRRALERAEMFARRAAAKRARAARRKSAPPSHPRRSEDPHAKT